MIDNCFNPGCRRELHYLRDGRVVRVIRGKGEDVSFEHYWLCGSCYDVYDFAFSESGEVTIERRSHDHFDEVHINDVILSYPLRR